MKPQLLDLFHRHIGMAFHRQGQFADWLTSQSNDGSWQHTVSTAELVFGGTLRYAAPYLGSYAERNHTWLWAWDNPQLIMSAEGVGLAERVRQLAPVTGCAVFAASGLFDADELFGETVAVIAAHAMAVVVRGLLGYDAYYTIPFTGGRGVMLFQEPALRSPDPQLELSAVSRFTRLISEVSVPDHKAAFIGYATDLGLTLEPSGSSVRAAVPRGDDLLAEFDHLNRLTKLSTVLGSKDS